MTVDNLGHLWILADQYVKEYNPKIIHSESCTIQTVSFR